MPCSRKRQLCVQAEPTTDSSPPTAKRRKLEKQQRHRTPSWFWDTGQLLKALNQRTEADMDRYACSEAVDCMEAYYKVGTRRQSPSEDVRYQDRSQEHSKSRTAIRRTV